MNHKRKRGSRSVALLTVGCPSATVLPHFIFFSNIFFSEDFLDPSRLVRLVNKSCERRGDGVMADMTDSPARRAGWGLGGWCGRVSLTRLIHQPGERVGVWPAGADGSR